MLDGLASFKSFLRSEFSEENLEFWMACEDYKKIKSPVKMAEKAKKIYEEFIQAEAPKEVGPDGKVGECGQLNNFPGRIPDCGTLSSHRLFLFESGPPFVSAY